MIEKFIKALQKLKNNDKNTINSNIRALIGLKSLSSSAPHSSGSRYVDIINAHEPDGITKLYTDKTFNAITCHINSSEYDEDKATLNKKVDMKIRTTIRKKIPKNQIIVHTNDRIKKGEVVSKGNEQFNETRANISGIFKIYGNAIEIENIETIGNGTKIQNTFLSKHTLVEEFGRFKFVDINKRPVKKETIETIKSTDLKPKTVNMTEYTPTIITGSKSVFKRRASGHIAQLSLGLRKYILNIDDWNTENEWDMSVYLTKIYDTYNGKYYDAIVGIAYWLISINSGGYEYKIGKNDYDMFGRSINSASVDPFSYKVMQYKYPDIANALLNFQLMKREEKIKEFLKGDE